MAGPHKIPERYRTWAREYVLNGGNATQAAIEAGYSPKAASLAGHRLTKNDKVSALVEAYRAKLQQRLDCDTTKVVDRLVTIAFATLTDFASWDTKGVMAFKSSEEVGTKAAALKRLRTREYHQGTADDPITIIERDIELRDPEGPLRMLGTYLQMWAKSRGLPMPTANRDQGELPQRPAAPTAVPIGPVILALPPNGHGERPAPVVAPPTSATHDDGSHS